MKLPIFMPPAGLAEINATFGNIMDYVKLMPNGSMLLSPEFEQIHICSLELPFSVRLVGNTDVIITRIRCHKLLREHFKLIFDKILDEGLQGAIKSFGGCFNFRQKRSGTGLSTHSWGIAIDLNPETNRAGTKGDLDHGIISIFKDAEFVWGGEWIGHTRDPMHFQFCSGY